MIITRQQRIQLEDETLAPYAVRSSQSRGRKFPEEEDSYRTPYQRDHDRIIHTTAFRRLEYKTQVFVNYEGDYYRTRLTHSLEVAQIGKSLAQALALNADLTEGICLVHDLGHSPFGHAGEHILNRLMADHGGFNHNQQTYRIVTELEERYPHWIGLNLTYEMLEGIVKHETRYDSNSIAGFDPALRGSLEAQLANMADEMAYNAHDLDDGLRSGLLVHDQIKHLDIWQFVRASIAWDGQQYDDMIRHRMIRRLIGLSIDDVVTNTTAGIHAAGIQTISDVQAQPTNLATYSDNFGKMADQLKDFLYEELYNHYRVVRMSFKAQRFIEQLFTAYTQHPRQLPPTVQQRANVIGLHRASADYIAGMTDRFALQEFERLFDPFTRP
ncbi:MAG: deoxyguanosinetriphosphate triphosphohydrolase [Anaerolineae bacterium]|nr:deoxyguanosinetriphosphate triphosphohydrolase [Anaerolineae bacterium]